MATKIAAGSTVRITYRIIDDDGKVLEEKTPENFYEYVHGESQIVPAVERALEGKTAGFQAEVSVDPHDGYGEYDESLLAELDRRKFPKGVKLTEGMKFTTEGKRGEVTVRVIEIDGDHVTVDGNHPLAGLHLIFDVKVLEVFEQLAPSKRARYH